VAAGELGYTKAREIVSVATPETQDEWLKAAKGTRKHLINEVKKVKRAAKVDPGQGELLPSSPTVVAPRELPVRFQVDLTPEQEARRAAMVERLHKLGGVPTDRAELMLEAMAALLETKELQSQKCPRGHLESRPPVQIHVHENAATGRITVQTDAGERELSRAESERIRCDAAICEQGGRNTTTIPPRVRREVLARDKHQCQAPGCGRTRFLEVHHITPRNQGGSNESENLMTLCASCHRLWHERGSGSVVEKPAKVA
jgi:5-methylcytosine-specific restriction endonuclease McrA